jgi:hypothetical protein
MEMRWIELDNLLRGTPRAMDSVRAALVRGPSGRRCRSRVGVLSAKFWPPFSLKPLLPCSGVRRTDGEPGNALVVFDDKSQPRFEKRIRRGIDVTDQLVIAVQMRSVPTFVAGCKGDCIKRVKVGRSERSDCEH